MAESTSTTLKAQNRSKDIQQTNFEKSIFCMHPNVRVREPLPFLGLFRANEISSLYLFSTSESEPTGSVLSSSFLNQIG